MKCPFRKSVIHKEKDVVGYIVHHAVDIEEFEECYQGECPYYIYEHGSICGKVRNELFKEVDHE